MSTFEQLSREVVRRFLHTVVVVDDKAFGARRTEPTSDVEPLPDLQTPGEIQEPGAPEPGRGSGNESGSSVGDVRVNKQESADAADPEELDARSLIELFAREGLVCAVLEPRPGDDPILTPTLRAAKRADVVLLDWDLHKDNGEKATEIINAMLSADSEEPASGRLRLIVIYTGAPGLEQVTDSIRKALTESKHEPTRDNFSLFGPKRSWRIVVLGKDTRQLRHDPTSKSQVCALEKLPERIRIEFATLTSGLISNVALESLATLRDNTHMLLGNLRSDMDPAYVAHRVMLGSPDDAVEYVAEIIVSEIGTMIHGFELGHRSAGREALEAWIRERGETVRSNLKSLLGSKDVSVDQVVKLVHDGWAAWDGHGLTKQEFKDKGVVVHDRATEIFSDATGKGAATDDQFAIVTSFAKRYATAGTQPAPRLTLGTMLKEKRDDKAKGAAPTPYLLCIQPRCDSVRVEKKGRNFIFIPAKPSAEGRFDLVIRDPEDGSTVRIELRNKAKYIQVIPFKPAKEDVIRAQRSGEDSTFVFEAPDGQSVRQFLWVGQLKEAQAQRIANQFAADLARVGLDEYEWLRRSALPKGSRSE